MSTVTFSAVSGAESLPPMSHRTKSPRSLEKIFEGHRAVDLREPGLLDCLRLTRLLSSAAAHDTGKAGVLAPGNVPCAEGDALMSIWAAWKATSSFASSLRQASPSESPGRG